MIVVNLKLRINVMFNVFFILTGDNIFSFILLVLVVF